MPLLWLIVNSMVEPGAGVELPPSTDQSGRWMVVAIMLGPPLLLLITGFLNKKPKINGPTPLAPGGSDTPRLDVNKEYLDKFVKRLEDGESHAQARSEDLDRKWQVKYDELERKYLDLMEKYAMVNAKYEALRDVVVRGSTSGAKE